LGSPNLKVHVMVFIMSDPWFGPHERQPTHKLPPTGDFRQLLDQFRRKNHAVDLEPMLPGGVIQRFEVYNDGRVVNLKRPPIPDRIEFDPIAKRVPRPGR
jgi:hypothetical protein